MKKTSIRQLELYLNDLGLSQGDTIMLHADLRVFGIIEDNAKDLISLLLDIVGKEGTIITPSFTFSFPEDFDLKNSLTTTGAISRLFSNEAQVQRLPDGMTSYYLIGNNAKTYINNWSNSSYGAGSIPDQMIKDSGKILQFGTDILSYIHYLEEKVGVPYREIKRFYGQIVDNGKTYDSYTDFYARMSNVEKIIPDPIRKQYYKTLSNSISIEKKELRLFKASEFMAYAVPILKKENTILVK
jgi:aminoglycoside 3-N-acetyltransferase